MIKSDSNNAFEIAKHLKVISLSAKAAVTKLWLFKHSLYEIHVIDINCAYPHHKIASEAPIQYFDCLESGGNHYVVVVSSTGNWTAYQITSQSKSIVITTNSQSVLHNT